MNIHQMQISYSPQEDRLILRINSKENEEMRLFFTRRIVTSFWDILNQTINHSLEHHPVLNDMDNASADLGNESARQQMQQQMQQQIHHQDIINESDYATPFNDGNKFPMGETPTLVEKITINAYENGNIKLIFVSDTDKNIDLNLNQSLLHNLSDLLSRVIPSTEWNIGLMGESNVFITEEKKNLSLH
ncbi:hypothetical protein MNB_SUP05-SYMBIONT-4-1382 [hydrothermal vent metagenome]|uniref:Uncharacterized protein n=1 Tax=hydrothermal vent metagenome TaxID=652676 RepID=A0A1W1DZJ3_9ZZZZ|nr:hypothetical protein [Gammaproteobacteria bacterium]